MRDSHYLVRKPFRGVSIGIALGLSAGLTGCGGGKRELSFSQIGRCSRSFSSTSGVLDPSISGLRAPDAGLFEHAEESELRDLESRFETLTAKSKLSLRDLLSSGDSTEAWMKQRARILLRLAAKDPAAATRHELPAAIAARLSPPARECVEQPARLDGTLRTLIFENADGAVAHYLETSDGQQTQVLLADEGRTLRTGQRVRVSGLRLPCTGEANAPVIAALTDSTQISGKSAMAAMSGPFGEHRIAVFSLSFNDAATNYTTASIRDVALDSVNGFFREASFAQTWATGQVLGPYTINASQNDCDWNTISSQARAAAREQGVDLSQFDHYVYVFPKNACGWLGLGTIGGAPSEAWINGSLDLHTVAHELGHNLGLYHGRALDCAGRTLSDMCLPIEYGDTTNIMGNRVAAHYTAFQKEQLGWLNGAASPTILEVSAPGVYHIGPFAEQPPATPALGAPPFAARAIKVLKSVQPGTGARTWFYAEYRQATGYDGVFNDIVYLNNLTQGLVVHTGSEANPNTSFLLNLNPQQRSWFNSALDPGESFDDAGSGVTFTLVHADAQGADIAVAIRPGSGPLDDGTDGSLNDCR